MGGTHRLRSASLPLPTFREAAERYIKAHSPRWRHGKTATNWQGSLEMYTYPVFGDTLIDRIARGDVLDALEPIWTTKPAIARKLRQRIRAIFADAMARGLHRDQPCWGGHQCRTPSPAGREGSLSGSAVPGGGRSPRSRGCFGVILGLPALLPLPRADGCTQWERPGVRRGTRSTLEPLHGRSPAHA